MEVTLEKIELVKDRTGVSYKEAKEALEAADGSVVDAIINIEETLDNETKKSVGERGSDILDSVKALVRKGNVSRIIVKKKDGEQILNLPVNAGIIATILAPGGILVSLIAAYGFKCNVEVVKTDGTIIDVSDRANDAIDKAKEKGSEFKDAAFQKGQDVKEKVQASEAYDKVVDKAGDAFEKTQEAVESVKSRIKKEADEFEDLTEEFEDVVDEAEEAADGAFAEAADTVEGAAAEAEDAAQTMGEAVDQAVDEAAERF